MNYVEITNGQITKGPMNLPKNYKNTSGFNLQSDAELKAIGWYPVEYVSVAYNSASHYIDRQDLTEPRKIILPCTTMDSLAATIEDQISAHRKQFMMKEWINVRPRLLFRYHRKKGSLIT